VGWSFPRLNIFAEKLDDIFSGRSGKEYFCNALRFEFRKIFLGNNASHEYKTIIHSFFAKQLNDSWAKRVMRTAQYRHTNGIDIFLQSRGCDHFRCLSQSRIDHFHSSIA